MLPRLPAFLVKSGTIRASLAFFSVWTAFILAVDLVSLDHNMPGRTGAEPLPSRSQLRPSIQVLIATGFLDTELELFLADLPSVTTLQKPFRVDERRRLLPHAGQSQGTSPPTDPS